MPSVTRTTGVLRSSSKNGYGFARFSCRIAASKASSGVIVPTSLIFASSLTGPELGAPFAGIVSGQHHVGSLGRHAPRREVGRQHAPVLGKIETRRIRRKRSRARNLVSVIVDPLAVVE